MLPPFPPGKMQMVGNKGSCVYCMIAPEQGSVEPGINIYPAGIIGIGKVLSFSQWKAVTDRNIFDTPVDYFIQSHEKFTGLGGSQAGYNMISVLYQ
jgi:hypothetical protein